MLVTFRSLSLIEGASLATLLLVAIPLRYYLALPHLVPAVGMAHGVLFLAYFVMSLLVSHREQWSVGLWLLVLGAGVVPFACLALERKLKAMAAASPRPQF